MSLRSKEKLISLAGGCKRCEDEGDLYEWGMLFSINERSLKR